MLLSLKDDRIQSYVKFMCIDILQDFEYNQWWMQCIKDGGMYVFYKYSLISFFVYFLDGVISFGYLLM